MSEKWAVLLTFAAGMVAFVVTAVCIKLLGGNYESMAVACFFWLCLTCWQSSVVVMRYASKRRRAEQRRR